MVKKKKVLVFECEKEGCIEHEKGFATRDWTLEYELSGGNMIFSGKCPTCSTLNFVEIPLKSLLTFLLGEKLSGWAAYTPG